MPTLLSSNSPLVIATHNAGKVQEIAALLAPFKLQISSAAEHNLPEPEENGTSFAANSEIKARAAAIATNLPALADDSGLVVVALDGAPGIYSARWAGEAKDFTLAMAKVEQELAAQNVAPDAWNAYFICDLCLCMPDGQIRHFEGRVDGMLQFPPRGNQGFGYDPIFLPESHPRTFGEMHAAEKQAISHRSRAFAKLVQALHA
ncbi:MAG: RdgB/HAM1 family non-canonical purine NTP pyrophosphatase [Alphaproteobacteria bacterium]|nr:RdgB/HAM1 family non-canonical purine NTP pyrophosphatase [Alphaproteobacteria bacterium]